MTLGALLAVALAAAAPAWGQKVEEFSIHVDGFQGVDQYHDSARLKPNRAQEAFNVFTERGFVEKRTGAVQTSSCTAAVENMTEFVTSVGNRQMILHCGDNLYQTNFGAFPTAISTIAAASEVSFTRAFNKVIAVDGTGHVLYDGSSSSTIAGFPQCGLVEYYLGRIWCGSVTNESTSRIRISSVGAASYWTVPANPNVVPDAPNFFDINRDDGQPLLCLKKTPWGVFAGKQRSLWMVKGYDNTNWYIQNVDPSIGCTDSRSIQVVDGRLQWLAIDGVYSWGGAGPVRLESQDVDTTVKSARQASAQDQSWTVDSQLDFELGTACQNGLLACMSTTLTPGSVQPSTWSIVDTSTTDFTAGSTTTIRIDGDTVTAGGAFSNSGFETGSTANWTSNGFDVNSDMAICQLPGFPLRGGGWGGSYGANDGKIELPHSTNLQILRADTDAVVFSTTIFDTDGVCYERTVDLSTFTYAQVKLKLVGNQSAATLTSPAFDKPQNLVFSSLDNETIGGGGPTKSWLSIDFPEPFYDRSSTFTSRCFDTGFSTPTWGTFTASISSSSAQPLTFTTLVSTSCSGVFDSTITVNNGGVIASGQKRFIKYEGLFSVDTPTATPKLYDATPRAATTGYYFSEVHFIGTDISSWSTFDISETEPAGSTITYQIRQGTYSFPAGTDSISWTNVTPALGIPLSISTPTYAQWRALLDFPRAALIPLVNLARVNWVSGENSGKVASGFFDHRYFLCIAVSSSTNDTCVVQQRDRDWVIFNGLNIGAMTIYDNRLYGGNALAGGEVWRLLEDGVYNDAGAAIDAYWTSPDYMFGDPVSRKAVEEMWVDAAPSTGTLLSVGYSVDRSTTMTSKSVNIGTANSFNRRVPIDARFALGKYFRFRLRNNELDKYFRVNGVTLFGQPRPRTD